MVAFGLGSSRREHQVTNVEVQVGVFLRRIDSMDIDIDCRHHHLQTGNTRFFFGLAQRNMRQIRVTVGVAARLEPSLQLGVEQHEACTPTWVDNERRTREVPWSARANRDVFVIIDEGENSAAVLVETLPLSLGKEPTSRRAILARFEVGVIGKQNEWRW